MGDEFRRELIDSLYIHRPCPSTGNVSWKPGSPLKRSSRLSLSL